MGVLPEALPEAQRQAQGSGEQARCVARIREDKLLFGA